MATGDRASAFLAASFRTLLVGSGSSVSGPGSLHTRLSRHHLLTYKPKIEGAKRPWSPNESSSVDENGRRLFSLTWPNRGSEQKLDFTQVFQLEHMTARATRMRASNKMRAAMCCLRVDWSTACCRVAQRRRRSCCVVMCVAAIPQHTAQD